MKTIRKRVLSLFTAMVMVCSLVICLPEINITANAATSSNWVWPTYYHSIQNDWPNYSSGSYHGGTDFPVSLNTPVYSSCDGEVVAVTSLTTSYGKHIKIRATVNGSTVYIRYCHLNGFNVSVGDHVKAGQQIAISGSTGNSTGPHLHYEVRNANDTYNPNLNPRLYLPGSSYSFSTWNDPIPVDDRYPKNYAYTAPHRIYTYTESRTKEGNRWADPGDACTIVEAYTDGFCKIIYPASGVPREAYALISDCPGYDPVPDTPQGHVMSESEAAGKTIPDGDYWIFSELGLKTYLDIPGADETAPSSTQITVYNYTDTMPKRFDSWTVTYLNNGFYKISQPGTNICLDVEGASLDQGTIVQTYSSNNSNAQQWSIRDTGHGYIIQSRANGYYLDVKKGSSDNGTQVITYGGDGTQKNQSWTFVPFTSTDRPIADGEYYIKSATGNAWLDVSGDPKPKGNGYSNESNVQIWNSKTDSFNVKYISDGYYKIYEISSGLALDVYNPTGLTFGRGTNVQVYDGSNLSNRAQLWRIKDEGNGNYRLISNLNGYSLDVNGGLSDKGTNVQIWTYNTSNAQKWSFEKVHKHSYTSTVIASTCTEKGYTLHKCSCGDSYTDNYTDVISHNFGSWTTTKAATCAAEGTRTHKCSVCGKTETASIAKTTDHKFGDWTVTKTATCAAEGTKSRKCTVCGKTETASIAKATTHSFGSWTTTKAATCAAEGTKTRKCSVCGKTENASIAKTTDHKFGDWTVTKAATCAAEGTKTRKCSVCGKTETASITKTTTHNFGSWTTTKAATCAAEGTKTRKCSICGKTENQTIQKSNKHKYKVETISPTTTEGGYDRHTCTLCGHFYIDNVVPPISVPDNPTVSYEKGDGSVKLTWNTVSGAQKYGIAGYQNGAWQLLDKTTGSSYTLKNLKAGTNYKIAVIAMFNSNWNMDFSKAITVTPNEATVSQYPVVQTQVKDSKIGFKWNKIPGVEKYGIGMYQANKWKVIKQLDGNVTTWTSPQISSGKYRLAVLAKVNGQWVNADVFKKSFYVTVE